MKIADAQRSLSLAGSTRKRTEAIATELRAAALLPKGGRGPHAPEADEAQVALLALAVAGAERVSDAVETATALASVVDKDGVSLLAFVARAIGDPGDAHAIRNIRVLPTYPMAEVTIRATGEVKLYFAPARWNESDFVPDAQGAAYVGPIGHIGGAVLDQLAIYAGEVTAEGEWLA